MNQFIVLAILGAIALIISASGFIRVVYYVSIGYAYSVAAIALGLGIMFAQQLPLTSWLQLIILFLYGLRLGTYILLREGKTAYKRELGDVHARESAVSLPKRFPIWIGVSILYVAMTTSATAPVLVASGLTPALFASGSIVATILTWVGLAIMASGFIMETLADWQKSRYKKTNPTRFCDIGLYRFVRCPNYLGEILVWFGGFIAGIAAFGSWFWWAFAASGLICIILIMMGSTKRLEAKQEERYGSLPDYQKFAESVPVLFPFVPVYSLKKVKVYLE